LSNQFVDSTLTHRQRGQLQIGAAASRGQEKKSDITI